MVPDLSSAIRFAFHVMASIIRAVGWVIVTTWMGFAGCCRAIALLPRIPAVFARTRRCPRGHTVPQFGVYECRTCRSFHEGWVFGRCKVCGESAGWTPCIICGLPVRHPLR